MRLVEWECGCIGFEFDKSETNIEQVVLEDCRGDTNLPEFILDFGTRYGIECKPAGLPLTGPKLERFLNNLAMTADYAARGAVMRNALRNLLDK